MHTQLQKKRWWEALVTADAQQSALVRMGMLFLLGFVLSAADLGGIPLPFCAAVICAGLPAWLPMPFALGAALGYRLFWADAGLQAIVWLAAALPLGTLLQDDRERAPLLAPSLCALIVAAGGVLFQLWRQEQTALLLHLLRIALAFASVLLVQAMHRARSTATDALAAGVIVLALSQISPLPYLNFGVAALGFLSMSAPFSMLLAAGLALDIASAAAMPMTAVALVTYLLGRIERLPRRSRVLFAALAGVFVMLLWGKHDYLALPALIVGSACAVFPAKREARPQQAQPDATVSRLESMAAVFAQEKQLLESSVDEPPDAPAILSHATQRACESCPKGAKCAARQRAACLSSVLLHQSAVTTKNMPEGCTDKSRLLSQVQCGREQYRMMLAEHRRRGEYRAAVEQQYGLLSRYLQRLSDEPAAVRAQPSLFRPETAVCSRGREAANGDRCIRFAGTKNRYYLLLCDGMGTGAAAAYEAQRAAELLRRMLAAGCEAEEALQNVNALLVLRGSAGAVTVDLVQVDLLSGRVCVYKWGAAPSWLLGVRGIECIGRQCPPPGIALGETAQSVSRISLAAGETLLLLSDGVDAEAAIAAIRARFDRPAGFLASLALEQGAPDAEDDATVAVLRLEKVQ